MQVCPLLAFAAQAETRQGQTVGAEEANPYSIGLCYFQCNTRSCRVLLQHVRLISFALTLPAVLSLVFSKDIVRWFGPQK